MTLVKTDRPRRIDQVIDHLGASRPDPWGLPRAPAGAACVRARGAPRDGVAARGWAEVGQG
jgi:hypothetical protein